MVQDVLWFTDWQTKLDTRVLLKPIMHGIDLTSFTSFQRYVFPILQLSDLKSFLFLGNEGPLITIFGRIP